MSNVILLKLTKLGLGLAVLTPLFASDNFMYPLIFPRVIYFRTIIELTAFSYALLALTTPRLRPNWRSPLILGLCIFFGTQVLSSFFGVNPYISFAGTLMRGEGVVTLAHLIAFCIIASAVLQREREFLPYLRLAVAVLGIESLLGLGQILHLPMVPMFGSDRANGMTGNPAFFAGLMIFGVWLPLALGKIEQTLASASHPYRWKIASYATVSALCLINLWQTQIRGANFALFVVAVALLGGYAVYGRQPTRKRLAKISLGLLGVVVALAILARHTPLVRWNATLERLSATSWQSITVQNRLISWDAGLQGFLARPWLGWGPENFGTVFDRYFNPALVRDFGSYSWYDRAHNMVIEVAAGSGMIGLTAYLMVFILAGYLLWKMFHADRRHDAVFLAALLGTLFLQNLSAFDTINTLVFLYLLYAYLIARTDHLATAIERPAVKINISAGHAIIGGLVTVVLVSTLNLTPAIATYRASQVYLRPGRTLQQVYKDFQQAIRLSPPQRYEFRQGLGNYVLAKLQENPRPDSAELDPILNFALEQLNQTVLVDQNNLQTALILSELARQVAAQNSSLVMTAQQIAEEIIRRAPARYHGYFALGRVLSSSGREQESIAAFQQALIRYPEFAPAHWNLAIAYILNGNVAAGQREADRASQLDPTLFWKPENIDKFTRAYTDRDFPSAAADLLQSAAEYHVSQAANRRAEQLAWGKITDKKNAHEISDEFGQQASEQDYMAADYYRRASQSYRKIGDTANATATARAAIQLNPVLGAQYPELDQPDSP